VYEAVTGHISWKGLSFNTLYTVLNDKKLQLIQLINLNVK
jgi:hypothetical protein